MATVNERMTALADNIRTLSGIKDKLGLEGMANNVGEANTEISTQVDLIAQITAALAGKAAGNGNGVTLPTLTNPGDVSDMVEGKEFIDANGEVKTGTLKESTGSIMHQSGTPQFVESEIAGSIVKTIGIKTTSQEDVIVRNGTEFAAYALASEFGDARVDDVTAGVTFTSVNGIKLTGTNTGGGTGESIPSAEGVEF